MRTGDVVSQEGTHLGKSWTRLDGRVVTSSSRNPFGREVRKVGVSQLCVSL